VLPRIPGTEGDGVVVVRGRRVVGTWGGCRGTARLRSGGVTPLLLSTCASAFPRNRPLPASRDGGDPRVLDGRRGFMRVWMEGGQPGRLGAERHVRSTYGVEIGSVHSQCDCWGSNLD